MFFSGFMGKGMLLRKLALFTLANPVVAMSSQPARWCLLRKVPRGAAGQTQEDDRSCYRYRAKAMCPHM